MNLISRKLRSQSGASMLIALMFMLFCLFVGGSVLAAATANGYRVAHMSDQQDFLNQRSAALLLSDELDGTRADNPPTLKVNEVRITKVPVKVLANGGVVADITATRKVQETKTFAFSADFTAEKPMTVLQRLMLETAVCRYLLDNDVSAADANDTTKVTLSKFFYRDNAGNLTEITSVSQFWYAYDPDAEEIEGAIAIEGKDSGNNTFTSYSAYFTSGAEDALFDFLVSFGDYSQMTVLSNAYMSKREIEQPKSITADPAYPGNGELALEVTASTVRTTIKWQNAKIEKEGA